MSEQQENGIVSSTTVTPTGAKITTQTSPDGTRVVSWDMNAETSGFVTVAGQPGYPARRTPDGHTIVLAGDEWSRATDREAATFSTEDPLA